MITKHHFPRKSAQTARFAGRVKSVNKEEGILLLEERGNTRKIKSDLKLISHLEKDQQVAALVQKTDDGWVLLGMPEKSIVKHRFKVCPY